MSASEHLPHIQIIVGSVRQGRMSRPVADWVIEHLQKRDDLTCELIDLADWSFPQFDLRKPPAMGNYEDRLQIAWARTISRGDAFLFVSPEYNHGYSGVLKTALDYLMGEWQDKPAACVSFGNVGGARMVENLQQVWVELGMIPASPSTHLLGAHGKRNGNKFVAEDSDGRALDRTVARLVDHVHRTKKQERAANDQKWPRILVLGLGERAIHSVVLPLQLNGWSVSGMTVPDVIARSPDAQDLDVISFGRGALGVDADQLKNKFASSNPEVRIVETFLPIATRQVEAACDALEGNAQALDAAVVSHMGDHFALNAEIAMETRLGVSAYTIEGTLASKRIVTIETGPGPVQIKLPVPKQDISGFMIEADGAEFVHVPIL
ncbi:NADPH-dependent FMN reductase [Erythrobacter litoralis]|uniref:NADPH-dependent FMN reductase n=1 Tax=Erythrobacter litoralis TaxID=39960 RepID=UPI002435DD60|nr:NAD(P)H-dependent oxidoreductase [Erythrobacter litoralis]